MSAPATVGPGRSTPAEAARLADATLPGTLALTGVTLSAAVGMGRLFADGSYLVPMVLAALVTHATSWVCRRAGLGLVVSVPAATAALGLTMAWAVLPSTTTLGVPGLRTLQVALDELARAADQFGGIVAPVPVTDGFLLAGMLGVGMAAVLGDWGAFRVRNLFEAALPSFAVVVVTATLGTPTHRLWFTGLYLAALFLFLVVHYGWLEATSAPWFVSLPSRRALARFGAGLAVGGAALLTAVAVGPRLPGADDPPVLDWRDGGEGGERSRTTVSPLVDIRGRLVGQSEVEVFTVRSPVRAYWRMTALDTFDGSIWSFNDRHKRVKEGLPGGTPEHVDSQRVVQEYTIASLDSIWLPAAYQPRKVEGLQNVSYNEALASLVTRDETSNGATYRVESHVPRPSAADLAPVRPRPPDPHMARFLRLPPISPRVRALAERIASEAGPSPFARAIALQDFFREGFVYDLDAQPGHDRRALERFLFLTKRGYCEQFSGAYAVMARAMNLPTRVAVGFTPGELSSDGRYHVRGLNAHAWPEVHIDGFGWVAFEPTPGRGAPGAEAYTGLPESQAHPGNPTTATTLAPGAEEPGTTPTTSAAEPSEAPGQPEETPTTAAPTAGQESQGVGGLHPLVVAALAGVLCLATVVAAVPAAKRYRRHRRRAAATTPADRVLVAWAEGAEALARAGAGRRPEETLDEHARRAAAAVSLPSPAAAALRGLARDAAVASYAPVPVGSEVADRAAEAAARVEEALQASASPVERVRWVLDPRPLVGRGEAAQGRTGGRRLDGGRPAAGN